MQFMVFRRVVCVAAVVLSACISQLPAQSTPDQLENALKGKRFALRNFSADQTTKYQYGGGDSGGGVVPSLQAFALFVPGSVKLKGTTLTIQGTRSVVLLDGKTGKPGVSDGTPAWLEIDLGAADPAAVLPKLQAVVFFPDLNSAANAIPVQFKNLVPYSLNPNDPGKPPADVKDRDIWYQDGSGWKSLPHDSPKITQAKRIHSVYPLYTSQARQMRVQGSVIMAVVITKTGKVESPWLLKPFGYRNG